MLRRTCALVSIAFALSLFSATGAATTAQRTFVASTGNDANPCSIAAPCRGFARAITQTSVEGEVIVLDSAGYGPATVTKSVSIIAPAGVYAGISVFSGDGITINAGTTDTIVLRGLSINGQGGDRGISLLAAARVRVEGCVVSGMHVAGISHTAANAELIVQGTIVRDNGGSGIALFADLGSLVLDHVHSEHNGGNGLSFTPAAGSLGALATISDSTFTHNEGDGIGADSVSGSTITLLVQRSGISSNGQNGFRADASAGSGVLTVNQSAINDNGSNGIAFLGHVVVAVFANVLHRNSGYGIYIKGTDVGAMRSVIKGNIAYANLGGWDLICDAPGSLYTDGSNAFLSRANSCTIYDPSF